MGVTCPGVPRSNARIGGCRRAGMCRPVKRFLAVALGILTAIGGFVDIGDIVANAEAGARFGIAHAWVLLVGVIATSIYGRLRKRRATGPQAPA